MIWVFNISEGSCWQRSWKHRWSEKAYYISFICTFHNIFHLYHHASVIFFCKMYLYIHTYTLTGHFIRHTLFVRVGPPFTFKTALILHCIDSTRCWKHSSEILVHIDIIQHHAIAEDLSAAHPWYESPDPPHPKRAHTIEIWWLWRPFE